MHYILLIYVLKCKDENYFFTHLYYVAIYYIQLQHLIFDIYYSQYL
jgi:hypothetical protein